MDDATGQWFFPNLMSQKVNVFANLDLSAFWQ